MIKKLQKSDYLFIAALLAGVLFYVFFLYAPQLSLDETFYPSVPLRLINGDSLMQHEWHLSQFSSVFLYLPVRIWLALKGSTEGIILFLRCLYLTIHTLTSAGIYVFFRKYGIRAIAAAMLFYSQVPYGLMAVSYNSMHVIFLLLLTLFLLLIYKKSSSVLYVSAGICFGACCVCNPFFCIVFVLYIMACILWNKKIFRKNTKEVSYIGTYNCFFSKKAVLFTSCGIGAVAVICIIYFFATGGTIASFFGNIGNLLNSSEYGIFSSAFATKLNQAKSAFNEICFDMPFLLPVLYAALFFDKNRRKNSFRIVYLIYSLAVAILFIFGIAEAIQYKFTAFAFSLPFTVFSTVCYILTENKNKKLFYCIWCPGATGAIVQFFASNTLLTASSMILAISNVAGVFFICDLFKELQVDSESTENKKEKKLTAICRSIICVGFCLQLLFQCYVYQYGRIPEKDYNQVTTGPYAGFYMNDLHYDNYVNSINDLDIIKARSKENDPVLIISCNNWMYLYIDRPFATFTAWQETFEPEYLKSYYEQNPDKIPKYIYVGFADSFYNKVYDEAQEKVSVMTEMFDCTKEELSDGILLTVNG